MGRPGRVKSKASEPSTSQDGEMRETPKSNRSHKRQGRPRKAPLDDTLVVDSPADASRDSTPFSPANARSTGGKRRTTRANARLTSIIAEFDPEEDRRSHRLARFLAEHPDGREEYLRLIEERSTFPAWIREKETIEYEGTIFRVGDIVAIFDSDDALPYFAQIRSMINDQFMRPFAWITWLAPRVAAADPHSFVADHFAHALIDNKLYSLESLRWECERPEEEAYQVVDAHRQVIDKHRLEMLRDRREQLFQLAQYEQPRGAEMLRAGDVKMMHREDHKEMLEQILEKMRERGAARRAAQAKRREEEAEKEPEEDEEEEDSEEKREMEMKNRFTSLYLSRELRSVSVEPMSGDTAPEEASEVTTPSETPVKKEKRERRGRTASQTSSTSKDSVASSDKRMVVD